jgi:hypothetical protein
MSKTKSNNYLPLFHFTSIPRMKEISKATFARHYLEQNMEEFEGRVIEGVNKLNLCSCKLFLSKKKKIGRFWYVACLF